MKPVLVHALRDLQRNILAGLITIGPLFVTWLVFSFVLGSLAKAGLPLVRSGGRIFPRIGLPSPWLQSVLAIVLTLAVLYVVGRVTSLVTGPPGFQPLRGRARAPALCRQGLHLGAPAARHHDGQKGVQPARRAGRLPHPRPEEHRLPHPHAHRLGDRRGTGRGPAAQRHQPHVGLSAGAAHGAGHRNRSDHGTGHEHADDRRRGGAETIRFTQPGQPAPKPSCSSLTQPFQQRCQLQLFLGVFALERHVAQADVVNLRPNESHRHDAQKRDQQNRSSACRCSLRRDAKETGDGGGHQSDLR